MIIEDGGKGYTAKITPDGQVFTKSVTITDEQYASSSGEGSYLLGNPNILMDGTNQCALYLKNLNNEYLLHVYGMFASTTDDAYPFVSVTRNPVYVSGGSAVVPENMNFGLNKTPNVEAYYGNNMTLSSNTHGILGGYIAPGSSEFPFRGSLILHGNDSIVMCVQGTSGKYTALGIRFYFAKLG